MWVPFVTICLFESSLKCCDIFWSIETWNKLLNLGTFSVASNTAAPWFPLSLLMIARFWGCEFHCTFLAGLLGSPHFSSCSSRLSGCWPFFLTCILLNLKGPRECGRTEGGDRWAMHQRAGKRHEMDLRAKSLSGSESASGCPSSLSKKCEVRTSNQQAKYFFIIFN